MPEMNSGRVAQPGGYPPGPAFSAECMVPALVGLPQADVAAKLAEFHLALGAVSFATDVEAIGDVISQTPPVDTFVAAGSTVAVVVGVDVVAVPDLAGLTEVVAMATLADVDLVGSNAGTAESTVALNNKVVAQDPAAAAEVDYMSTVSFTLGAAPVVPDLDGMTQVQAEAAITAAGLSHNMVSTQESTVALDGKVVDQNPAAGTLADPDSDVDMTVGAAPVIPVLVGLTAAAADAAITGAGLTVGTVTTASGTLDEVLSCTPTAGTKVDPGSSVAYVKGDGN